MGGDHRTRHAFLVVAHAVGGRGLLTATALSVEALGRVVPGLDPRIDVGHAVTALGVGGRGLLAATAPAVSVRVPMPVGGCGAIARSPESLAVRRAITCFSCPLAVRGSRPAGQTWSPGGCGGLCLSASCGLEQRRASFLFWRGVHLPLSRLFLQELAKFFMGLSGSSSLGAPGVLAGVTASAAASGGIACPSSPAAGAATFCAATVTPAGAGVLPAAPAAGPGVSGDQRRQGMSRSHGRCSRSSGNGSDGRA